MLQNLEDNDRDLVFFVSLHAKTASLLSSGNIKTNISVEISKSIFHDNFIVSKTIYSSIVHMCEEVINIGRVIARACVMA